MEAPEGLDRWLVTDTELWWEEPSGATLVTTLVAGREIGRTTSAKLPTGSDALLLGLSDGGPGPLSWLALRRKVASETCRVPTRVD